MYQKRRRRHRAVGIDGSPELPAMEEASCAVLSAHVMVRVAIIIPRLLVPRKALNPHLMRFRELVPAQKRELGGRNWHPWRIFEREENPSQEGVCVIRFCDTAFHQHCSINGCPSF